MPNVAFCHRYPGGTLGHMTVKGNTWLTQWAGEEDGQTPFQHRRGHANLGYCKARSFSGRWAVDRHLRDEIRED
jgi:hypothetical protein